MHYRVKPHPTQSWTYEQHPVTVDVKSLPNLLARVIVADVWDPFLCDRIIASTPMLANEPGWRSHDWVRDAFSKLAAARGLAISRIAPAPGADRKLRLDWDDMKSFARKYAEDKVESGRYASPEHVEGPRPTWDMRTRQELWS